MLKQRVFIGSSREALPVAGAVQDELQDAFECVVWDQTPAPLGVSILQWLVDQVRKFDYAIFVYAADDIAELRGSRYLVARDNVVLEHGLFLGTLGPDRVFFITPSVHDLRIPSDLGGILHGSYEPTASNLRAAVGPFCRQVKAHVEAAKSVTVSDAGVIWEGGKLNGAHTRNISFNPCGRIQYAPTHFHYRSDDRRCYLNYDIHMTGAGVDFRGPVRAMGPVRDGWGYLIYEATDARTKRVLTGVSVIHVPSFGHGIGYWMTRDLLPDASSDGVVFGGGAMAPKP
jgi:predicted nucleotide-binding protein with TIR-like domain